MNSNQHRLRLTPCVPENDEEIQELALEVLLIAREREALPPLQNRTEVYRDIKEMRREKTLQTHSKSTTFLLSGIKPYVNPVQNVKTFERSIWGLTNVDLAGADDLGRVYLLLRSAQVRLAIHCHVIISTDRRDGPTCRRGIGTRSEFGQRRAFLIYFTQMPLSFFSLCILLLCISYCAAADFYKVLGGPIHYYFIFTGYA